MRDVPRALRRQVRKTHIGLGHLTKEVFLRMLRLGGASPVAQEYARAWQRPVCEQAAAPARPRAASTRLRPLAFNDTVAIDEVFQGCLRPQLRSALRSGCRRRFAASGFLAEPET